MAGGAKPLSSLFVELDGKVRGKRHLDVVVTDAEDVVALEESVLVDTMVDTLRFMSWLIHY